MHLSLGDTTQVSNGSLTASVTSEHSGPDLQFTISAVTIGDSSRRPATPDVVDASVAPFVPLGVLAAVLFGEDLQIDEPLSRVQITGAQDAAKTLGAWLDKPVPQIRAVELEVQQPPATGVGLFFTRGIDSWASYLDNRRRVTHLLYLDGVEPRHSPAVRQKLRAAHVRAGADLALPVVILDTDARAKLDPFISWELSHGAFMAACGLALSPMIGEMLIASSHVKGHTRPWGTHALLDPQWSSAQVGVTHDGDHRSRWQKTALVASNDTALGSLHVCFEGGHDRNCGKCRKCLLTMSALEGLGVLERCDRFDAALDPEIIKTFNPTPHGRGFNSIDLLNNLPIRSELSAAWAQVIDPSDMPERLKRRIGSQK